MELNFDAFMKTLPVSLLGWLGVFVVISIVYFSIVLLNKFFPGGKE